MRGGSKGTALGCWTTGKLKHISCYSILRLRNFRNFLFLFEENRRSEKLDKKVIRSRSNYLGKNQGRIYINICCNKVSILSEIY